MYRKFASSIVEVIKSTGTFHLSYSLSVGVKIGLFYIAGYLILYLQGLTCLIIEL